LIALNQTADAPDEGTDTIVAIVCCHIFLSWSSEPGAEKDPPGIICKIYIHPPKGLDE
jgi:hypothetical protein